MLSNRSDPRVQAYLAGHALSDEPGPLAHAAHDAVSGRGLVHQLPVTASRRNPAVSARDAGLVEWGVDVPDPDRLVRTAGLFAHLEAVDALLNSEVVDGRDAADGRLGASRHNVAHVVDDPLLTWADECHELVETCDPALAASTEPARLFGGGAAHDLAAIAGHLGPGVRLYPVHPGAAKFEVVIEPVVGPRAAANTISSLEGEHAVAGIAEFARRDEPRETCADDDDVDGFGGACCCFGVARRGLGSV